MSSPTYRSPVTLASCLALLLSILPLVAADPPSPLPFLVTGSTYILTSATPDLPNKVKILGNPVAGQWVLVECEILNGFTVGPDISGVQTRVPKKLKKEIWINFATVSSVRLWEEALQPAPDKK